MLNIHLEVRNILLELVDNVFSNLLFLEKRKRKESKEILYKNEIVISTSISKPPSFNYVVFIKNLIMELMCLQIEEKLKNRMDSKKILIVK